MDTTKNISLGGFAFTIDESAYQLLSRYLQQVRISLKHSEDVNEIIYDVEQRLAELLKTELKNREVINLQDVERVMEIMGKPEQFRMDDEQENTQTSATENFAEGSKKLWYQAKDFFHRKKLYRDGFRKKIGGVVSGFARYLDIDLVWARILLLVFVTLDAIFMSFLFTLPLLIFYAICWLVVPEAQTTTDRLKMEGKPVNIDTIAEDYSGQRTEIEKKRSFIDRFFSFIGGFFKIIGKIILFFILGLLAIVALCFFIVLLLSALGLGIAGWGLGAVSLFSFDYLKYIIDNQWVITLGFTSLLIVLIVPVVGFVILFIRLVGGSYRISPKASWVMTALFFMAMFGLTAIVGSTARDFTSSYNTVNERVNIALPDTSTLTVRYKNTLYDDTFPTFDTDDNLLIPISDRNFTLGLRQSSAGTWIEEKRSARGKNQKNAKENTQNLNFPYEYNNGVLSLPTGFSIHKGKQWRQQEVALDIYTPENTIIDFQRNMHVRVYLENGDYYREWIRKGMYRFENNKLICLSCQEKTAEK
ncbi:MAG: PspC domain-containing protein [Capnocytophaga sp.]|nr:PspC domain-containing protein [Capnocytophaga sp.]